MVGDRFVLANTNDAYSYVNGMKAGKKQLKKQILKLLDSNLTDATCLEEITYLVNDKKVKK